MARKKEEGKTADGWNGIKLKVTSIKSRKGRVLNFDNVIQVNIFFNFFCLITGFIDLYMIYFLQTIK